MLLVPIWRGIPIDYKRRYAREIWQQFEDNVRAAAYTSSLSRFYNSICSRLAVNIRTEYLEQVNKILMSGNDRDLLKMMRDEATTVVLMVRLENEARKAEWQERQADDEAAATQWFSEEIERS
jgi:hypothetical protein